MSSGQKKKIYVGLSGGVDSAVTAALLVEAGYDVTGVFMRNWLPEDGGDCPWEQDAQDGKDVCEVLGIEWKVYKFEKEYKERVLDYFFEEYRNGRTPNPDILCNNLIKFDLFANRAFSEGAEYIATGHYARRRSNDGFNWEQKGDLDMFTALDPNKDQTYFLQRLSKGQLSRALFPLGNYYKEEVRMLAHHFDLPNADKKDSQGICFIGDLDVHDFIKEHLSTKPGNIIDVDSGEVVGKHQGLWFYTIGQRRGIQISSPSAPYFVVDKDLNSNELLIGKGRDHKLLIRSKIKIENISLLTADKPPEKVGVSIRYRENPIGAKLAEIEHGVFEIESMDNKKFWAPASGQGVLLYDFKDLGKIAENRVKYDENNAEKAGFMTGETFSNVRNAKILGSGVIK